MVRIRGARPDDWPAVAEILAQAGLRNVIGQLEAGLHARAFGDYLSRSDVVGLVAEEAGRPVGYLGMEIRTRLTRAAPEAWIPNLAVAEGHQGRGVGPLLLAGAEGRARALGCEKMTLTLGIQRDRAHAFYGREGWMESGKAFSKML